MSSFFFGFDSIKNGCPNQEISESADNKAEGSNVLLLHTFIRGGKQNLIINKPVKIFSEPKRVGYSVFDIEHSIIKKKLKSILKIS